jgi:hypothetical protein
MRRLVLALALMLMVVALPWLWTSRRAPSTGQGEPVASNREDQGDEAGPSSRGAFVPSFLGRSSLVTEPARVRIDQGAGAGVMEGEVLSSVNNEPVAGAELTFARGERVSSTITNSFGFFAFEASQSGLHQLVSVTAEGFFPFAPQWGHSPLRLMAQPGRRIENVIVHLEPAIERRGVVLSPQGQPVPGAEVRLFSSRQALTALLALPDRVVANDAGEFSFQAPLGTVLQANHPGFRPARYRISSRSVTDRPVVLRLRDGQGLGEGQETIMGRVVDEQGQPQGDVALSARLLGRRGAQFAPVRAVTDQDGEFVLEGLLAGSYQVEARAPGWMPARLRPVRSGAEQVALTLRRGAVLRGTVTEAGTGRPVPGFTVMVERRRGPLRRLPYRSETFLDPQGRFEFPGLEPHHYAVTVRAQGYSPSHPEEVTVRGNEAVEVAVALSQGGRAGGTVVDAETGQPIAWAQVLIEGPAGDPGLPVPLSARTVTDQAGQFFLAGLAPGRRSLLVEAEGYHQRILSGVTVDEDHAVNDLRVELRALGPDEDRRMDLVGIGAVLSARGEGLVIVRLLREGGALAAGLRVGDAIIRVDGHLVTDLGFSGAVEQIRGQEGTAVRLVVRRRHDGSEIDLTVPRLPLQS